MRLIRFISGLSFMLLFAACQESPFYMTYKPVDTSGWDSRDTIVFMLPEIESPSSYNVNVSVRTIQSFKYDNIGLAIMLYEGRNVVSKDTVVYDVYDSHGENKGKGFPYVEYEESLTHTYYFNPGKRYKIKITHVMRLDPLAGLANVGVTLNP